jgi:cell shape-determining protein MreC
MTISDPRRRRVPAVQLGLACGVALALALLPTSLSQPLKHAAQSVLRPGQIAAVEARAWCDRRVSAWRAGSASAEQLAALESETEMLRRRNAQLTEALDIALSRREALAAEDHPPPGEPLLLPELLTVRVLGRQSRAFLTQGQTLDAGAAEGLLPRDLVLEDSTPLVDRGRVDGLEPGRVVLAGRYVWGRIDDVGPHTATVRRVTDPGFRELVQLARGFDADRPAGPRGILEGTGDGQCRIRLVETTAAVSEGDLVLSTGGEGVLEAPLIFGRISRVEHQPAAAHWDIWMEPAARAEPTSVAVLRIELNQARLASAGEE